MSYSFERSVRIARLIKKTMATLLKVKAKDPRFSYVTITDVRVSHDFSYAEIFVSLPSDEKVKEILIALNKAVPYFRHLLAVSLKMRSVPKLHFVYDDHLRSTQRLIKLIDQIDDTTVI